MGDCMLPSHNLQPMKIEEGTKVTKEKNQWKLAVARP